MTSALIARFATPPQDLAAPSLFAANCDALSAWLETLPKTNLGQTTRSLYHAVTELNRVRLTPVLRLQLLEILRPAIYYVANGLRRHYLNQPIVLPEQPHKVAELTHVLYEQLATGYVLVAVHVTEQGRQSGFSQPQQALATAAHRGMVEHSQNLLRDCQLYRAAHPGCWRTLHRLAALAREHGVDNVAVADDQNGDSTLESVYLRALLLGTAKTNQLRQDDMSKIFRHLLEWSSLATLTAPAQALLLFDADGDDGPVYSEFAGAGGASWCGLKTEALAGQLLLRREQIDASLGGDSDLGSDLLGHLVLTWSTASTRSFLRMEVHERVDIALGLTAAHHFSAGEVDFSLLLSSDHELLAGEEENPFLRRAQLSGGAQQRDVWDSAYMAKAGVTRISLETIDYHIREQHQKTNEKDRDKFRSHAVDRVNISPGGLCIKWPPDDASQIRTGEIVGIREPSHQNWSIGAVRWVRLLDAGPQLGIELLSPTAAPYGARVLAKSGAQGDYLRVLLLPEIKQTGQPTTVITPRLPFRTGQKVSLLHRDKETRIQLTRKIASTAAFSQFEFRRLSGLAASAKPGADDPARDTGFDSLWDNL